MNNIVLLQVQHEQQISDWDCGITCLKMLIQHYQRDLNKFNTLVRNYDCNQSTWTVDLLHLLKESLISARFNTITYGCSTEYDSMPYYQSAIKTDRPRVEDLFVRYKDFIDIKSNSLDDIMKHLDRYQRPCLVLIDASKLRCSTCQQSIVNRFISFISSSSYQGHYVLVIGYKSDTDQRIIYYADPGQRENVCSADFDNFEEARKAEGTDEDMIFCYD